MWIMIIFVNEQLGSNSSPKREGAHTQDFNEIRQECLEN